MKEKRFCYANLTLEDLQFYTGITSKELFRWVLSMIEDKSKIFAVSFGRPFTYCINETQAWIV